MSVTPFTWLTPMARRGLLAGLAFALAAGGLVLSAYPQGAAAPSTLGGGSTGKPKIQADTLTTYGGTPTPVPTAKVLSEREKREGKGHVSRSDLDVAQDERNLSANLDLEIQAAESLLQRPDMKNSPQRPEIMRRVIEAYHTKSTLMFFDENRRWDAAWKAWDKAGRKGSEPVLDMSKSQILMAKVIERSSQMIREYPKDNRLDEAYFTVAFSLEALNKRDDAEKYYLELVRRYPSSRRIADSWYALGEYYFDKLKFKESLAALQRIEQYPRAPIYPWSVYKQAWVYFNLQNYRQSLGQFQRVVALSSGAQNSMATRQRLKEESLRDMVNVYIELNDIDGAEKYFAQVGGEKYYGDLLLRLADNLKDRGSYDEAVKILKKFVYRNPLEPKAAEVQMQAVTIADIKPDKALMFHEMKELLNNFSPDSVWGRKNANAPEYKELAEKIHALALSTPKRIHQFAQKNNNKDSFKLAEFGYQLYLSKFFARPEAFEVRFRLGEIQYLETRYDEALKSFMIVAGQKEKTPFFQKAGEYMLSSAVIPVDAEMKALRDKGAKLNEQPLPLSPQLKQYIQVCDQYVQWFPKEKSVIDCQVDTAEIYLKTNQYAEAEKRLMVVAKTYSARPEGRKAAEILLVLSANNKPKLMEITRELIAIKEYNQGDLGKRLATIIEANRFDEIMQVEKSGKYLQAAQDFEKLAVSNPNGQDVDKAWYNAGLNYRKAGETDKAVAAFVKVYENYPKSVAAPEAIFAIIDMSEDRLQLDRAAQLSMVFMQRYPQDKRAAAVANHTCFLYDALNDLQRATDSCSAVIKMGGAAGIEASQTLADLYERNGRYRELVPVLDQRIRSGLPESERIVSLARAADAERKIGRPDLGSKREEEILRVYNSNPKGVSGRALGEVAHIIFDRQMPLVQNFRSARLVANKPDGSDLAQSIENKQNLMNQVEAGMKKVLETREAEWSVAALFTIGATYEVLAADVRAAPMPPNAPAADAAKLRQTLNNAVAQPATEKSRVFYLEAMKAIGEFGIYTEYSRRTSDALARIEPKSYRKIDEWLPEALFVGSGWSGVSPARKVIEQLGGR